MSKQATKRLNKEYKQILANPPPYILARPSESNILDWHLVITGPPGTPYENGQYHGRITFPSEYPFKPRSIKMCTPSGRFEINTRLCLSMSDFHEESWNPSWSVATIATGLLSFMTGDERTTGSIVTSEKTKVDLAKNSKHYNTYSNLPFKDIFPEIWEQNVHDLKNPTKPIKDLNNATNQERHDFSELEKIEIIKDINKIEDPEDRIRARLINGKNKGTVDDINKAENTSKDAEKNRNNLFAAVGVLVLVGMFLRFFGVL